MGLWIAGRTPQREESFSVHGIKEYLMAARYFLSEDIDLYDLFKVAFAGSPLLGSFFFPIKNLKDFY